MRKSRLLRILAHLSIVGALILVPSLWLAPPTLWRLAAPQLAAIGIFPTAYVLAVFVMKRGAMRAGQLATSAGRIFVTGAAVFGVCFITVISAEWLLPQMFSTEYSREALFTSFALSLCGFALVNAAREINMAVLSMVGCIAFAGLLGQAAFRQGWLPQPVSPSVTVSHVETSLYRLKFSAYRNWIPTHWRKGGGITVWGTDYLFADGNGSLYLVRENAGQDGLEVTPLPYRAPLNDAEFVEGAKQIFKDSPNNYVESGRFRVADVLVQDMNGGSRILVSHHYWRADENCFVLRVSALEGAREQIVDATPSIQWRTIYDTTPCLKLNTSHPRGPRFEGLENGGRMTLLDENNLLLSVGDHGFDGVNRPEMLSQDPDSSYGKIMNIRLETRQASMYSMGHRNVQGLYIDPTGNIWATEHGPRGGDELNLIESGKNYGWPIVTYGTDYSRQSWPNNQNQGDHLGYEPPVYAFIPSIGISNLTGANSPLFPLWSGDLLIASLKDMKLWRTRVRDDRVVFSEPIPYSQRIRDVIIGPDGRIVLWTDDYEVVFVEPANSQAGDALASQCTGCHGINPWDPSSALGPNLYSIVDRRVASRNDFTYSEALKKQGGRWTRKRLDEFLVNPQKAVPGTNMQFPGMADPQQREQLIDFLENLPDT